MPILFGRERKAETDHQGKAYFDETIAKKMVSKSFDFLSTTDIRPAAESRKDWSEIIKKEFPVNLVHRTFPEMLFLRAKTLSGGATNLTSYIQVPGDEWVGRCPGNLRLDRASEKENLKIAFRHGVGPEVIFDDGKGRQLSKYLKNPITMSEELLKNAEQLKKAIAPLKKIHECGELFVNAIDVFKRNDDMSKILDEHKQPLSTQFNALLVETKKLQELFSKLDIKKVPCHMDTTPGNFVESNGKMVLIDWEYAGNCDPVWDLMTLALEAKFSPEQEQQMFSAYFGDHPDQEAMQRYVLYKPVYALWGILWAKVQLANKNLAATTAILEEMVESRWQDYQSVMKNPEYHKAFAALSAKVSERVGLENADVETDRCTLRLC